MTKNAIILFSGGLDSTTVLKIAQSQGFCCYALSFNYGQKHVSELDHAKRLATKWGAADHRILNVAIGDLGGSALTDTSMSVEDYTASTIMPTTYVPARNIIFLSLALAYGEIVGATDIFIGANEMDYSGYPDCRPAFLQAFEQMANLGTKAGSEGHPFHIHAPLLQLSKADIIREGIRLGINYAETVSCYRADDEGRACGRCDSCMYRKKGFHEAGVADPTRYV